MGGKGRECGLCGYLIVKLAVQEEFGQRLSLLLCHCFVNYNHLGKSHCSDGGILKEW